MTTTQRPLPLRTFVPRKAQLLRSASAADAGRTPVVFSTAKLSPVSTASLTKKSVASITTASAGTRLPADSAITSPGTRSRTGRLCSWPSRSTLARVRTLALKASAAVCARYSRAYPIPTLATRIDITITASTHCEVMPEIAAANTSSNSNGLRS